MRVHVRFFAILRQIAGVSEMMLELSEGASATDAGVQIAQQFPGIAKHLARIAFAVNQNYVPGDTPLHDGDELALIPPVSGGTEDDWIDILPSPLDCAAAITFVSGAGAGGINIFLGTTRADTNALGHQLLALDYEAYEKMARKQLMELAARARTDWPIVRLVILHRVGRVAIGGPSVLIAVACPHRAEAFAACRWLIDMLKKETAIWKKEIWDGGDESWSGERR